MSIQEIFHNGENPISADSRFANLEHTESHFNCSAGGDGSSSQTTARKKSSRLSENQNFKGSDYFATPIVQKSLKLLAGKHSDQKSSISALALENASTGRLTRTCDLETLVAYQKSKGKPKAKAMLSMLDSSMSLRKSCMKVFRGFNQLNGCGHKRRRFFYNKMNEYPEDCQHGVCHKCDAYYREQEAYAMLQRVLDCFADEEIDRDHVSWVTINISKFELGADCSNERDNFRVRLDALLKRALKGAGIVGSFQIAIQEIVPGLRYSGMLHLHATFIHPEISRDELEQTLKKQFQLHNNAVDVAEHYTDQDIDEAVLISSYYAADITTKGETYGSHTGEVFALYLQSVELMRKGGRQGFRCDLGQRRLSNKIKDAAEQQKQLRKQNTLDHISNIIRNVKMRSKRWNRIKSKWSNNHLNIMVCPKLHGIQGELPWPRFEVPIQNPLIIWQDNHRHRCWELIRLAEKFQTNICRSRFSPPTTEPAWRDYSHQLRSFIFYKPPPCQKSQSAYFYFRM